MALLFPLTAIIIHCHPTVAWPELHDVVACSQNLTANAVSSGIKAAVNYWKRRNGNTFGFW